MMLVEDIRQKLTGNRLLRLAGNQELLHKVVAAPERQESSATEGLSKGSRLSKKNSRNSGRSSRRGPSWSNLGGSNQVHPAPTSSTADARPERSSMWFGGGRQSQSVASKPPRVSSRMSGRAESSTDLAQAPKSSGAAIESRERGVG